LVFGSLPDTNPTPALSKGMAAEETLWFSYIHFGKGRGWSWFLVQLPVTNRTPCIIQRKWLQKKPLLLPSFVGRVGIEVGFRIYQSFPKVETSGSFPFFVTSIIRKSGNRFFIIINCLPLMLFTFLSNIIGNWFFKRILAHSQIQTSLQHYPKRNVCRRNPLVFPLP